MKKLEANHYTILLAVIVAVVTVVVALTLGRDLAISILCTGIGCLVGLIIGTAIRKKTKVGKAVDEMNPNASEAANKETK